MSLSNAVDNAQAKLLSIPATPARDRDRHPFPSSQSPLRQLTSSSTSSNLAPSSSSSVQISPQAMSVDALLKQHAAAPDPRTAAFEHVVNDRNVLSSQNAQLWKLIEKQRAGYNQILKELERIRGERDGYKSKLIALGALPNGSERRQKPSIDRAIRPSLDLPTDSPSAASPSQSQSQRFLVQRHNSDDTGLTPHSASYPPALHPSRSLDPLSARSADTELDTPTPLGGTQKMPPTPRTPRPSATQARLQDETSADTITTTGKPVTNGYYSPVRPNPRKSSLAESVSSIATSSAFSHSAPSISISTSSNSGSISSFAPYTPIQNANNTGVTIMPTAAESRQLYAGILNADTGHHYPNGTPSLSSGTSAPQTQPPSRLAPVPENRHNSRDSRISLPEEAKQYITNMTDSPVTSPVPDTSSAKAQPATSIPPPLRSSSADSGRDSEFLDMGDEESNEADSEDTEDDVADTVFDIHAQSQAPPAQLHQPHHERDSATYQPFHPPNLNQFLSPSSNSSREDIGFVQSKRRDKSRGPPEEFPLPPHHRQNHQQNPASQDVQHYYGRHNHSPQSPPMLQMATSTASPARMSPSDSLGSNGRTRSPEASHVSPSIPAAFRALPLLSSDLPNTTVTVSHSFVRPNDRGKEVLSFIVFVYPGNGKEAWKVEKMYSDVLNLDQRVRNTVGKGVVKKIANLPEGKLWKDHAPAKVDQRKAVLEHYLQSLIRLPVKNNDEVIAFFTSDIVREQKQPVMQIGHKEGYLTKRGKNFGGWKTRFFVLQGPVLEYYDCRGGTHLGSITITGAQIARQHKTEKPSNNDDEKEYRHAFLIVEAKKGPSGNSARHVLCAESDEDRDSWVEMLVRYYTGTYSEDLVLDPPSGLTSAHGISSAIAANTYSQPRTSISSDTTASPVGPRAKSIPRTIRDEISRGPAVPISQLPPDATNVKLFQPVPTSEDYARSSSPSRSLDIPPGDRQAFSNNGASEAQKRMIERSGLGQPSSLPDSSPLSLATSIPQENNTPNSGTRANSELGHYPDLPDNRTAKRQTSLDHRPKDDGRKPFLPGGPSAQSLPERAPTPEGKAKISGPMNGAPIPAGFKFGAPSTDLSASNDRREKAKSRSFWGFGKGDKQTQSAPRIVFGVPLAEALEVSQICNLPSIIFRSIQYLETKKADQEEGIYRLSGSSAVIKALKDRFNNEGDVDLLGSDEYWDPHAIAGLLKSFLRELPSSILTRELHLRFLAVIDFVDPQERIKELSQLIGDLPLENYSLLRALTAHLILIVQNSNVNKMTMRNVGIVFSPTLGIPAGVFSLMLGEFNRVFNVDAARDAGPADQNSELLRRNSQRYSDAAADQLLGLTGRTLSPPAEDTQSEGDDSSIRDESETETTENEATVESSSSSPIGIRINVPESPDTAIPKSSKAQHAASSKGLNVIVSTSERGNRHSRLMGLPLSPRPQHSPSRQEKA